VHHGTLAGALTARPRRSIVVGAKAITAATFGLIMGVLGIVASLAAGVGGGIDTGDMSGAASRTAWALAVTTVAATFGLGVGIIVRHSAGAATTVLVWALVVETTARGIVPATVSRLLPFTAVNGILGTRSVADTEETLAAAFSNTANITVLGLWAAITIGIGSALLARRDS
jgi:hypothetical protein